MFTPNTELAKEFAELAPTQGEHIISKNYPSSFAKTDLDSYLKSLPSNVGNKIVLTGSVFAPTLLRVGDERTDRDQVHGSRLCFDDS